MATVLPATFTGKGYQVTVNADRTIVVKPGDWLSKYTMAIWGDYSDAHIAMFKRQVNGVPTSIGNPDLIRAGDTLYVTGRLPGETGVLPGEDTSGGSLPGTGHGVDKALLEKAAARFQAAVTASGRLVLLHIAQGLLQFARGLRNRSGDAWMLDSAAANFEAASAMSGTLPLQLIALGLERLACSLKTRGSDRGLLDAAANTFRAAQPRHETRRVPLIALGLEQLARGLRNWSRDRGQLETATINFRAAATKTSETLSLQLIALGLMQFARSLS
jgi:hypothetical protein